MTTSQKEMFNGYDKREIANIGLFSLGKFISIFGSSIYTFAVGLYILQQTGSGLSFATTLVLGTIPMVLINPFAGVLADRINKKKLVVAMDILNGALLLAVYYISLLWGVKLTIIYFSTFLISVFTSIFSVSIETAKPNMVTNKRLMNINSVSKSIDSLSGILGPMIGGIVFVSVDITHFILFNGLSFIFSGILELFIDFKYNPVKAPKGNRGIHFKKDIKEGLRYIKENESIAKLTGTFVYLNFFIGLSITIPLPFIITEALALNSSYYGIIQGGFPIGMIIGALMVKTISQKTPYKRLLKIMCFIISALMILIGVPVLLSELQLPHTYYLLYYSTISILIGCAIALVDIPILHQLQTTIPEEYRGRVLSIGIAISKAVLPIALISSGILVNHLPATILPITGGFLLFITNKTVYRD
ncbi:MFS transporter [Alkaliphilus pronyensis]|uniref:MFS transporter n=1 Tax=Alkaliphilus pronyensis TaxID=1482732 RepID=A0A6I0FBX0_9FIRM|nr:MFS transporter [Alkaliphilus pronyensis]KAB3530214.1 MFS transporter [Alkaliphilus pronyensis]